MCNIAKTCIGQLIALSLFNIAAVSCATDPFRRTSVSSSEEIGTQEVFVRSIGRKIDKAKPVLFVVDTPKTSGVEPEIFNETLAAVCGRVAKLKKISTTDDRNCSECYRAFISSRVVHKEMTYETKGYTTPTWTNCNFYYGTSASCTSTGGTFVPGKSFDYTVYDKYLSIDVFEPDEENPIHEMRAFIRSETSLITEVTAIALCRSILHDYPKTIESSYFPVLDLPEKKNEDKSRNR
jgi:hypothetical protein